LSIGKVFLGWKGSALLALNSGSMFEKSVGIDPLECPELLKSKSSMTIYPRALFSKKYYIVIFISLLHLSGNKRSFSNIYY
jgi:hypothetical protein